MNTFSGRWVSLVGTRLVNGAGRAVRAKPALLVSVLLAAVAGCDAAAAPAQQPAATTQPAASQPAGTPVIRIDEAVHDFGVVWMKDPAPRLDHTFKITNAGTGTLRFLSVNPICGCTKAGPHPQQLGPGETGDFPFQLNSASLHGDFSKYITITTNDPKTSASRLYLKGQMKWYVDVSPYRAYFGRVYAEKKHELVCKVTNNTDQPLKLALTTQPANVPLDITLKETAPGKEFELRVETKPPYRPGTTTSAMAILETNVETVKQVQVPIYLFSTERLDVTPTQLVLRPPQAGVQPNPRGQTWTVQVTNGGEVPVKVLDASVDDPQVKASHKELEPGKKHYVTVNFPWDYVPPRQGRTLTIRTDDADKPVVRIPIRGSQSPSAGQDQPTTRPVAGLIDQPAPPFSLVTMDGKPVTSQVFGQHVATVLNFVAADCPACKAQIPMVEKARSEYEAKGVLFLLVVEKRMKDFTDEDVVSVFKTLGSGLPIARDTGNTVGRVYKITSYPTMVVVRKDGKVGYVNVGSTTAPDLTSQLDGLIAGKPVAPKPMAAQPAPTTQPVQRPAMTMINQPAPAFSLPTLDGTTIGNEDFGKHVATVLNFIAPNCGYCKRQVPEVEKLRAVYEGDGIRFVNIVQRMGSKVYTNEELAKTLGEWGSKLALAPDPGNKVGQSYKATGYPTMMVVDKSGTIRYVNIGAFAVANLKPQLDGLLSGKPIVQAAAPAAPQTQQERPAMAMVNQAAPAFALATLDGKAVNNEAFGKHSATVLNFIAPNCPYCKRQVPEVDKLRAEYEAKGVLFVNVAETMRKPYTNDELRTTLDSWGSGIPVAPDPDNKVGLSYKATSYPTMMVVDKNGAIKYVNIGYRAPENLKTQLDTLLAGKPAS